MPMGSNAGVDGNAPNDRRPFAGLTLCPYSEIGPLTVDDFATLVRAGGGTFVMDPKEFLPTPVPASLPAAERPRKPSLKTMIFTSTSSSRFNLQACRGMFFPSCLGSFEGELVVL